MNEMNRRSAKLRRFEPGHERQEEWPVNLNPKIHPDETERKPVCAFCDSTDVREAMPGFSYRGRTYAPDYICKECGSMTSWYGGACWDDLSEAGE